MKSEDRNRGTPAVPEPSAALERYRRGEISLDRLAEALETLGKGGAAASREVQHALDSALRAGKLPREVHADLTARLSDATRIAGKAADESDETRLIPARESDDQTRLIPAGSSRPPGTRLPENPDDGNERTVATVADDTIALPAKAAGAPESAGEVTRKSATTLTPTRAAIDFPGWERQPLKVGDVLKDRFVLEEVLGKGGMGVVFKALDLRKQEANDREPYVALKVLNQDFRENPISLIALQREAKRAQTLAHPNIITVYDFDRDGTQVYMSMEYLPHRTLSQFIKELPAEGLPFRKAWPIILGMGSALAYAHKKGIVHSDFKPSNVFIDDQNEIKVLDFGIACALGRSDKGPEEATIFNPRALGALTPAYAALEMFDDAEPDPRDDIYALACVAYELLTGKHPFGKLTAQKALELNLQPKPVPGLSRRQQQGLRHGLALKRADRAPTVDAFLRELRPRSMIFYGSWLVGLVTLALTAANVYINLYPAAEPPKAPLALSPQQEAKVKDLLELAEIHFEVGYLTAPTGSNALWAYREALKIDPYNEAAIKGIKKIADAEEQAAWELYERGDRVESMKKVTEGLEADPQHEGLRKLKEKLQR